MSVGFTCIYINHKLNLGNRDYIVDTITYSPDLSKATITAQRIIIPKKDDPRQITLYDLLKPNEETKK